MSTRQRHRRFRPPGYFMLFVSRNQHFTTVRSFNVPVWHASCKGLVQMIRITVQKGENCTVVGIDGQLAEADLDELGRVRSSVSGATVLNLRGLDSCAAGGIQVLRAWLAAGARLEDATPYLRMMLEDGGRR